MKDLSVIIPARNEEFLKRTIDSVLKASRLNTEVIAVLDGYWPDPVITDDKRVTLIHYTEPIGQRAAVNQAVKISNAKYIMKLDAHCSVGKRFDEILLNNIEPDWTVVPRMYVLDAFHWLCDCGKWYHQGPEMYCECGELCEREIIWLPKKKKRTDYMWIDKDLRIQYFDSNGLKGYGEDMRETKLKYSHKLKDWAKGNITDVMTCIGAGWLMEREQYWKLGGMDEKHGSWGQMAVELSMKTWLSGGRMVVNKNTWFAHLARTQTGFMFPYDNPPKAQVHARQYSRDIWLNNKWEKQIYNIEWLIDKFSPLPGWKNEKTIRTVNNNNSLVLY